MAVLSGILHHFYSNNCVLSKFYLNFEPKVQYVGRIDGPRQSRAPLSSPRPYLGYKGDLRVQTTEILWKKFFLGLKLGMLVEFIYFLGQTPKI